MAKLQLNDSGIIFNEAEHTYYDPIEDKYLSGITTAIHNQIAPEEFDSIPEDILAKATQRGKESHSSIENFLKTFEDDGSPAVSDFINLCSDHNLCPEVSEYTVTDYGNYASNIDCVLRVDDTTFDLADVKTFSKIDPTKHQKTQAQLSIYAYMFELVNPKATVRNLYIIHIRNTEKEHICELVPVTRIPKEACMELLQCELEGHQWVSPFGIPDDLCSQEALIRQLMQTKAEAEEKLNAIKAKILEDMEKVDARSWSTGTMKITRKLPSVRTSINTTLLKEEHPEIDFSLYERTTNISGSLLIAV